VRLSRRPCLTRRNSATGVEARLRSECSSHPRLIYARRPSSGSSALLGPERCKSRLFSTCLWRACRPAPRNYLDYRIAWEQDERLISNLDGKQLVICSQVSGKMLQDQVSIRIVLVFDKPKSRIKPVRSRPFSTLLICVKFIVFL